MAANPLPEFRKIEVSHFPPAAWISLTNPPVNVIDTEMMDELQVALEHIETRPELTTIVFSGGGQSFSTGVDIAAHTPEHVRPTITKFHGVIRALIDTQKVTIAAVHGNCLGGGAELALVCDIAYSTPAATWGFPEIKLACFPPVAVVALAPAIGQKRAAEMVMTGKTITGQQAYDVGLVNAVGDPVELARECVDRLAQLSPAALRITKKVFYAWDAMHFDKGLTQAEQTYFNELIETEDAAEGIRAFLEKRKAVWSGR